MYKLVNLYSPRHFPLDDSHIYHDTNAKFLFSLTLLDDAILLMEVVGYRNLSNRTRYYP